MQFLGVRQFFKSLEKEIESQKLGALNGRLSKALVALSFMFFYFGLSEKSFSEEIQSIPEVQRATRKPAFSNLELHIERNENNRWEVKSVDEDGPFAGQIHVGESFEGLSKIPRPIETTEEKK